MSFYFNVSLATSVNKILHRGLWLLVCIFLLVISQRVSGQAVGFSRETMSYAAAIYNQPPNVESILYNQTYSSTKYEQKQPVFSGSILKLKDEKFIIGINILPSRFNLSSEKEKPSLYNKNRALPANAHLYHIKHEADERHFPPQPYSESFLKRTNADAGFIYELRMGKTFLKEYNKCRVLVSHKEGYGNIYLYFFYHEKDHLDINGKINKYASIFTFSDNPK